MTSSLVRNTFCLLFVFIFLLRGATACTPLFPSSSLVVQLYMLSAQWSSCRCISHHNTFD
jgi:hypothetical protein